MSLQTHTRWLTLFLLVAVFGAFFLLASRSDGEGRPAHLYYQDRHTILSVTIGARAAKIPVIHVDCGIGGFATTMRYLIWTTYYCGHSKPNSLYRANHDGTGRIRLAANLDWPQNVIVAAGYIFWIDGDKIGRIDLDGTDFRPSLVRATRGDHGDVAEDLATDGTYVYFTRCVPSGQTPSIGRMKLDGTGLERSFIQLHGSFCPQPLTLTDGYLYWGETPTRGNTSEELVGRASVDGKTVERAWLHLGPGGAYLAAGAGRLFWTWGGGAGSRLYIGEARLDGRIVTRYFARGSTADVGP